jgi:hypothetical protein
MLLDAVVVGAILAILGVYSSYLFVHQNVRREDDWNKNVKKTV